MFPIYIEPYFSVVWPIPYGFGWIVVIFEGVVRSFIKFLIVPNAKVAKLWCSSIGRTKISTCRYWVFSKLTRTQNRPFFNLRPRHFKNRIFQKYSLLNTDKISRLSFRIFHFCCKLHYGVWKRCQNLEFQILLFCLGTVRERNYQLCVLFYGSYRKREKLILSFELLFVFQKIWLMNY